MNNYRKIVLKLFFALVANVFLFVITSYAENLSINFSYGIHNVAKNGNELPIELVVENRDTQAFNGYLNLSIYENNSSVFVYKIDLSIPARDKQTCYKNISITNFSNTIIIDIYNKKEELVANDRTSIDLSYFADRVIVGAITSEYNYFSYIDNLLFTNTTLQTKLVEITDDDILQNKNSLDLVDILLISDIDLNKLSDISNYAIYSFMASGKPVFISLDEYLGNSALARFLLSYEDNVIAKYDAGDLLRINYENGAVYISPYSFKELSYMRDNSKKFIDILEKSIDKSWFVRMLNTYTSTINNDYYNISNLLNIIDRMKLPDIFVLTVLLIFYVAFLTIIIYVFLRNINKREYFGKVAIAFSIFYTIVMFSIGFSVMKKNTFLTYISIVSIKNANTKETAFLNFRTSESGNYKFNTSENIKLQPILRRNKEPIISLNFMDKGSLKTTTFTTDELRTNVSVENARDFDSNLFVYENSNYLNDIYNVDCEFQRINGIVTGRVTNNMDISIRDAYILLFGKILKIGDIEPNHSVSLSRAENIGVAIGNNSMLADIMATDVNQNIIKYYLDENMYGYFDYGLLFGFIDNNGTIDINSNDVGDVYGRTLLVTRVNKSIPLNEEDHCSLEYEVNNLMGYYDNSTNTVSGDEEIINEYVFDKDLDITKLYFERIDSYDHGNIDSNIPFYGDVLILNYVNDTYVSLQDDTIEKEVFKDCLTPNNHIIVKFVPSSRDPLYRKISLPILRAVSVVK